ncbi:hypothetical protein EW146_g1112 [Bondarzewia mesenterica]|uniref:DUF6532 domain-containing protein n=1 Tax=Bondarzewia mesenterica TaxID=1095465 RepID=A0A4S4MB56_9AGAM|nr:hypothetical protein EW146_g1112 [Bondarzewia mesenterica]
MEKQNSQSSSQNVDEMLVDIPATNRWAKAAATRARKRMEKEVAAAGSESGGPSVLAGDDTTDLVEGSRSAKQKALKDRVWGKKGKNSVASSNRKPIDDKDYVGGKEGKGDKRTSRKRAQSTTEVNAKKTKVSKSSKRANQETLEPKKVMKTNAQLLPVESDDDAAQVTNNMQHDAISDAEAVDVEMLNVGDGLTTDATKKVDEDGPSDMEDGLAQSDYEKPESDEGFISPDENEETNERKKDGRGVRAKRFAERITQAIPIWDQQSASEEEEEDALPSILTFESKSRSASRSTTGSVQLIANTNLPQLSLKRADPSADSNAYKEDMIDVRKEKSRTYKNKIVPDETDSKASQQLPLVDIESSDGEEDVKPQARDRPKTQAVVKWPSSTDVVKNNGKVLMTNQTGAVRKVISLACTLYVPMFLCFDYAFPAPDARDANIFGALIDSAESLKATEISERLVADPDYVDLMATIPDERIPSFRNKFKRLGIEVIKDGAFSFHDIPDAKFISTIAALLNNEKYIFPGNALNGKFKFTQPFCHPSIAAVIRKAFFVPDPPSKPLATFAPDSFKSSISTGTEADEPELPRAMVALAATVVGSGIEEYQSGRVRKSIDFSYNSYGAEGKPYTTHMKLLNKMHKENVSGYHKIMHHIYVQATALSSGSSSSITSINPHVILADISGDL